MKKVINLSIIISVIFFSGLAFGQQENEVNYEGAWQVKVQYRQKADFKETKEAIYQEIEKVLDEKGLLATERRTIMVMDFEVEIMSQTEFNQDYKWTKVLYTN